MLKYCISILHINSYSHLCPFSETGGINRKEADETILSMTYTFLKGINEEIAKLL